MRVLLVSPYFIDSYQNNLSMGSAVKLSFNLSREFEVKVLTSGRKVRCELISKKLEIISVGGVLIPDPVNYMISFPLILEFIKQLGSFMPDVVVVSKYMFFSSFVIPIAKLMGFKVVTVTDTFPGINWFSKSRLTSCVMWLYARIIGIPLLLLSDKVVLLYEGLESIAKKFRLNFITIPNGVDSQNLKRGKVPVDLVKPKTEYWIGFVGRPESAKGYLTACRISEEMKKFKDVKMIFVGGGTQPHNEANRVYLGFRRDVINIYQLFNVLILPSNAEGLPNVVMEAMSQSVPVVASSVGGVKYLIKDGINGFLIEGQDVKSFVDRINLLRSNPKLSKNIAKSAHNRIARDYNWKSILESYKLLLNKICAA